MQKNFLICALILILSVFSLAKIRIVTSINIIEDWLTVIGGSNVEIHTLITGLETPHTYSPRPSDTLALNKADAFIGIGLGLESWLEPLIESSRNKNLSIYYLSDNVTLIDEDINNNEHIDTHHHHQNPHIWLSLSNAKQMVVSLSLILSRLDPENKDYYNKNSVAYISQLKKLKEKYQPLFFALKDKRIVSFPASYPYLFSEMGLVEVARGEEIHGQEPSAKKMVSLVNLMKQSNIKILVAEKQFSSLLPKTLAKETNSQLVYLSPLLVDNQNYLELMESNYVNLLAGLSH
ncbi:MAG TPA: zinc ABC transporter solute-binding protein [Firmicutes bacterium]|nr:zinc ABC transporter solute-binding protein [Bacillota bacterium]